VNGLFGRETACRANGLSVDNGLSGVNGLSGANGLMTTDKGSRDGRIPGRALRAAEGDTLVKQDQYGVTHVFEGGSASRPRGRTAPATRSAAST
jgi:hypothetical protein